MKTSVLINNYNNGRYLGDCIESVLAQSVHVDEVIIYDDGSTDESLDVLRFFGSRIQVIAGKRPPSSSPAHRNQGNAIETAFRASTGDLIFLLDSDDLFHPARVSRYTEALARNPDCTLIQSPLGWIDGENRVLPRLPEPFRHVGNPLVETYRRQDPDFFYPTSALAFPRTFLVQALPVAWDDGIPLWADTRLCLAAMLAGQVCTLGEELGAWRKYTRSHSARAGTRTYLVRQTWRRTQVFNTLCKRAGARPISVWRNRRFYLQLLRAALPGGVSERFRQWTSTHRHDAATAPVHESKAPAPSEARLG